LKDQLVVDVPPFQATNIDDQPIEQNTLYQGMLQQLFLVLFSGDGDVIHAPLRRIWKHHAIPHHTTPHQKSGTTRHERERKYRQMAKP
jgi:hypothetical protein